MEHSLQILLKIILASLFLICLADMPYGYFQLVRFVAACSFIYLGISESKSNTLKYIYFALAVLFQPLIKIALGRLIWNIVDVVTAIFLILSIISDNKKQKT